MRVLLVLGFPYEGTGSGTCVKSWAKELIKLGHDVAVIAVGHKPITGYPYLLHTVLTKDDKFGTDQTGIKLDLPFNYPTATTDTFSDVLFTSLSTAQRDQYLDVFEKAIATVAAEFKPDILHVNHCWGLGYVASKTGLPFVLHAHGTDQMVWKEDVDSHWRPLVRQGIDASKRILCISRYIKEEVDTLYGNTANKSVVIFNGYDDSIFKPGPTSVADVVAKFPEIPADTTDIILYVGRLTGFKGIDILIDAAAQYEPELPKASTVIVGSGKLEAELKEQVEKLKLKRIFFLGHQNQHAWSAICQAASVSVVPSRHEPFGLTALEALACGTPVVGSKAGGLVDFLNDKVACMVEMGSVDALAKGIVSEIKANSKQTKGKAAAAYALDGFSWGAQTAKQAKMYAEAVQ